METHPAAEKEQGYSILGPAVRSGGTTAEGPGDVTRTGLGGAYAACTSSGSARRRLGGMDAACVGGGPTTRGWCVAAMMYAVCTYGGALQGEGGTQGERLAWLQCRRRASQGEQVAWWRS